MAGKESGCGCGALLLAGLVLIVLPLLPYILGLLLVAGLLTLAILVLQRLLSARGQRRLRLIAASATQRLTGQICRLAEGHAELVSIAAASSGPNGLRLSLRLRLLAEPEEATVAGRGPLRLREQKRELTVPRTRLEALTSPAEFSRYLRSQDITVVNDLSVEARATQAAFQCLRERDWAQTSLRRLEEMIASTRATLAKASGNELLEPSIPQLQEALVSFEAEHRKLEQHQRESDAMLRKLHDFLSVPEAIHPIFNFDLEGLFDPSRLKDLRASFDEVVTLNDAYRALSRQRIA